MNCIQLFVQVVNTRITSYVGEILSLIDEDDVDAADKGDGRSPGLQGHGDGWNVGHDLARDGELVPSLAHYRTIWKQAGRF